ncbi:MAG: class I SAM-dependent methyltransferase [Kangiellaceae bacterium]|nr:class I SAM-dependent methyltransferase [Kangiellaceae bacterium]
MSRKDHWEDVYQQKESNSVSWFQENPGLSLQLIKKTKIDFADNLIDVGGGASVLVDNLLRRGYQNISVLDISGVALQVSRERLTENTELAKKVDKVDWIVTDITQFKSHKTYKLWHDRAVFHFLTEQNDRDSYLEKLSQYVDSGGHVIIAAFAIGGPEKCSGLPIVQYDEAKIINELGTNFELVECFEEQHVTPWDSKQYFKYFRFVKN